MTAHGTAAPPTRRFSCEKDVEVMARVQRVWDDEGVVDLAALELGEVILKVVGW